MSLPGPPPDRPRLAGVRLLPDTARAAGLTVDRVDLEIDGGSIRSLTPSRAASDTVCTPAFHDAHVHCTATGLTLTGLDLAGCGSRADLLDRVASAAAPGQLLLGHGWDESAWPDQRLPTTAELTRAVGAASGAYLSRADLHSALAVGGILDGVAHDEGRVRLDDHHVVRSRALSAVTPAQVTAAQRATRAAASALGIGWLHEMSGPEVAGAEDLLSLQELTRAEPGPGLVAYWGELGGHDTAAALGAQPGGDLFLDGSFGSHTAALRLPYTDAPSTSGALRYDVAEVAGHVREATRRGMQAGFHCIGDAAIDAAVDALAMAADELGAAGVAAMRHRLEHLELPTPAAVRRLAGLGVVASVQPGFDARWAAGMYVERLGPQRAAESNPMAGLAAAGVALAFGSDAPVTPMGPWSAIRAAVRARHAIDAAAALHAHTAGAAVAARDRRPAAGRVALGAPADLAVWSLGGRAPSAWLEDVLDGEEPALAELWVGGRRVPFS